MNTSEMADGWVVVVGSFERKSEFTIDGIYPLVFMAEKRADELHAENYPSNPDYWVRVRSAETLRKYGQI